MADVNVNFELEPDVTFLADLTVETSTPTVHGELSGRDYPNQHPISAITGLEQELSDLGSEMQEGKTAYETIQTYGNIVTHNVNEFATSEEIATETNNREIADNNLQSQIDAIVSSSDVFDIVGTYAELQAYNISTVPVNDIIKVLVDSTHSGAATYYRCVENGGVKSWSYIGSEGAYYTKAEADSLFVPQTRTVNNKALSSNITLTASDVGALPSSTTIPTKTSDLTNDSGYITGITSSDVTTALGYTPYNSSNPAGYITNSAIVNMQTTTNLVTSVSSSSTDSQYPSAKLFYDTCGDIETLINAL